jgi:ribonuclease HI
MSITDHISKTRFAFQNVHKSRLTVHELLENLKNDIDFLFVQENPFTFIRNVPSSNNEVGDPLIGPVHHRQWQCVEKTSIQASSQVAIYINKRLLENFQIFPNFSTNIDPNVLPVTLKHNIIGSCSFTVVNVYNPPKTRNSAVRALINLLPHLPDALVIQGDFNLPSGIWDPSRNNSSPLSVELFNHLSDNDFGLCNDEGAPTWTNRRGSFSVLDLVFIKDSLTAMEPDVFVNLEGRGRSDHAILSLAFGTTEHWGRPYIPAGEEEEERFISDIAESIHRRTNASADNDIEQLVASIGDDILDSWNRNSKTPRIGSSSVTWWTSDCQRAKDEYLASRTRDNQRAYDAATKKARTDFFNRKIDLMTANDSPWEGVRWTKPRPPPKYSTIRNNGQPIEDVATLFDTMHGHFSTSTAAAGISWESIDQIPQLDPRSFPPISQKEIWDALRPTTNSSAPGPDHVTWRHIKLALSMPEVDEALAALYNKICFSGTWPTHFKDSYSVIIPKPNKPDYSIPKAYRPIALLNTLGKLLTKILANRLQHDAAEHGILHRDQFGGIQGHSTIDAGLVLADFISEHRERGWHTSTCAIDVAQFFPSLSHPVMGRILGRLGFSPVLVTLIGSYFQGRMTTYKWDSALSKKYPFSLGTPQGDCLSPILSALYISVAIRKVFPETMPPATTRCLFYVDDGIIITASPSLQTNIAILRLYLLLLFQALADIGLQVESSKTELMHFFAFELTAARRLAIVQQPHLRFTWRQVDYDIPPSPRWRYLGFFFTPTLDFTYHVQFYTNKAFSTIRACAMLGNSVRGIGPRQRAHAYQACVLSVLTYGLALWYTTWGAGVIRLVKKMERVHSYALGWVIGAFRTSPVGSRELIAGIPPLKIILNMRLRGTTARLLSLGENHALYRTWTLRWLPKALSHTPPRRRARHLPTDNPLTRLSATSVKEQFFPHHPIARPGERVADIYADRILFDLSAPKRSSKFFDNWVRDFKNKIESLKRDNRSLIFTDGAYWSRSSRASYAFTAYHSSTWHDNYGWCTAGSSFDAEIAALEEAVQWAVTHQIPNPIFFIDNKSVLLSFLNLDTHSSQMASVRLNILLKDYLSASPNLTVTFAYCPSHVGIAGNERADRLTKDGAAIGPTIPLRILRSNFINEFKRDMTRHWRILAKSQTYKGRNWFPIKRKRRNFKPDVTNKSCRRFFMTLSGNEIGSISRMARAVTNHAPTGEYRQCFHPTEPTHCKHCGPLSEHTRNHIFFACPKYEPLAPSFTDWKNNRNNDKPWKTFFQANPSAFTFGDLPEDVH